MPENDDDDLQIEIDRWSNYPTEPIAMSTPELNWKVDKYLLTIKDSEFYYRTRGPGDKYDVYHRSTFDGDRTRTRTRCKEDN